MLWVPANNLLKAGTVPANNFLKAGTVPANNHILKIIQTLKNIAIWSIYGETILV